MKSNALLLPSTSQFMQGRPSPAQPKQKPSHYLLAKKLVNAVQIGCKMIAHGINICCRFSKISRKMAALRSFALFLQEHPLKDWQYLEVYSAKQYSGVWHTKGICYFVKKSVLFNILAWRYFLNIVIFLKYNSWRKKIFFASKNSLKIYLIMDME